jgi:hypothetical protein
VKKMRSSSRFSQRIHGYLSDARRSALPPPVGRAPAWTRATLVPPLVLAFALALGVSAGGCTPDVPKSAPPVAMVLDLAAVPPRLPQPTGLIVRPEPGGHIDFRLAGTPVPSDCSAPQPFTQAECEFDTYLQTLDGFPTVTPAAAPATAALDPTTLTLGTNVVVMAARAGKMVTDVGVSFDATTSSLLVQPARSWTTGEAYWIGVRGYQRGVKAVDGADVVGSPTHFLLKQETPLTCGAADPSLVDPKCPAFVLLSQGQTPAKAAASLFQLEAIRLAYQAGHGWDLMALAGLPKGEIAVLWEFPIHSSSVAELDPAAGLAPRVAAANEIDVAVQGPVDPTTVSAFVPGRQTGTVVLIDLVALLGGDLAGAFPPVTANFVAGAVAITGSAPFVSGHRYGLFLRNTILDDRARPLVPSPVSVLLTLRGSLVDGSGHSTVSTVADGDAAALDVGRLQLATLFDNPMIPPLTGLTRESLVYCFAFTFEVTP